MNIDLTEDKLDRPLVSIWCLTYNHKDFIQDALDGFLMQKTTFPYEVYIFDDASTDGTSDIIRAYAEKYPEIIHPLIMKKNTFRSPNRRQMMRNMKKNNLKGKYIALCEGDDCWVDSNKLQIQVDYMEKNKECSLYMHNALWLDYESNAIKSGNPFELNSEAKILSAKEVIMQEKGHPPTASFLFRRELYDLDDIFYNAPIGDYPLQLGALTTGYIYYNSRIMSVYRYLTPNSYSYTINKETSRFIYFLIGVIQFLYNFDKYTKHEYHKIVLQKIQNFLLGFMTIPEKNKTVQDLVNECKYPLIVESQIVKKIEPIRLQMIDEEYCADEVKEFVHRYEHIVVMGIGHYAKMITKQLQKNNISFEGYAVSKKKSEEEMFLGKSVWQLDEIPFEKDKIGILVAIYPKDIDDLEEALKGVRLLENSLNPYIWK